MDYLVLGVSAAGGAVLIGVLSAFLMYRKFSFLGSWVFRINWWVAWWTVCGALGGLLATLALFSRLYLEEDVVSGFNFPDPLEYVIVSALLVGFILCLALERVSGESIPTSLAFSPLKAFSRSTYGIAALTVGSALYVFITQFGIGSSPEGFGGVAALIAINLGVPGMLFALAVMYRGAWDEFEGELRENVYILRSDMGMDLAQVDETHLHDRVEARLAEGDNERRRVRFSDVMDIPEGRQRNLGLAQLYIDFFRFPAAAREFRDYVKHLVAEHEAEPDELAKKLDKMFEDTRTPRLKTVLERAISKLDRKAPAPKPIRTPPSEEPEPQPVRLRDYLSPCEGGWELKEALTLYADDLKVELEPGVYRPGVLYGGFDIAELCEKDATI